MSNTSKLIQDLILFYVKENYNHYLIKKKIEKKPENQIKEVVQDIYGNKKDHLKEFLKEALQELMKDDYIGDLPLLNICNEILSIQMYGRKMINIWFIILLISMEYQNSHM